MKVGSLRQGLLVPGSLCDQQQESTGVGIYRGPNGEKGRPRGSYTTLKAVSV